MSTRKSEAARRPFLALIPALLLLAAGCGYRGPLYLPEEDPAEAQMPEVAVTGDAEEEGDEEERE